MSSVDVRFVCIAVPGLDEIGMGDDLAALVLGAFPITDGDILAVTSKVVSKAEGRVRTTSRAEAISSETDRVVARRGETSIVRTHSGLVLAAAGIDASNTEPGSIVLLPLDSDASARRLREGVATDGGPNIAVVVTDTLGRAWRNGQTDVAIGAAGLEAMHDYAGRSDGYGNVLAVTAPAVADEIAGAADLVKGKLARTPFAVLRGLGHLVSSRDNHGPGARALVRAESQDMFGLGSREAVQQALRRDPRALRGFGAPVSSLELRTALHETCPEADVLRSSVHAARGQIDEAVDVHLSGTSGDAAQRALGAAEARLLSAAFALGWIRDETAVDWAGPDVVIRFRAATP